MLAVLIIGTTLSIATPHSEITDTIAVKGSATKLAVQILEKGSPALGTGQSF